MEDLKMTKEDIINSVITLKEACEILGVSEATLRTRVLKKEFQEWECRKSGGVILFCKQAIIERKNTFRLRKRLVDSFGGNSYGNIE